MCLYFLLIITILLCQECFRLWVMGFKSPVNNHVQVVRSDYFKNVATG